MDNAQHDPRLGLDFGATPVQQRIPFRIVVLGDFSAGTSKVCGGTAIPISQATLHATMEALAATLHFEVENFIVPARRLLPVIFRVTDMSDLTPAGVIAHVPELTALYLFRERLRLFMRSELTTPELIAGFSHYAAYDELTASVQRCRAALATQDSPPPVQAAQATPRADVAVERILDIIAAPGSKPQTPVESGISGVIDNIGKQRRPASAPPEIARIAADLTALLDKQITAVLHHPLFRRMEAAWYGMSRLLDGAAKHDDISIELLDVTRDRLLATFDTHVTAASAAVPPGLILVDFSFGPSSADVSTLQALGEGAMALQAPVVFTVPQDFFGVLIDAEHALPFIGTVLDQARFTTWNALRRKECTRWLCGAFNEFVLRLNYTCENTQGLEYTEQLHGLDNIVVWGNSGWLIAMLVARSVAKTHWPTQITGMRDGQVAGLDLRSVYLNGHTEIAIPLHASLTMQNAEDLARFGFAALVCQPNRDATYVLHAPTLRANDIAVRVADESASLPYQLFAARVTALLSAHQDRILSAATAEQVALQVQQFLSAVLADTGPGHQVRVSVQTDAEHAEQRALAIEMNAGRDILNGATLHLNIPLSV